MKSPLLFAALFAGTTFTSLAADDPATVLARILAQKGAISTAELATVEASSGTQKLDALVALLSRKGLLTPTDVARLSAPAGAPFDQQPLTTTLISAQAPAPPPKIETSAPPVTSASKLPITVYGTLLVNSILDTSLTNIEDIPLFAGKQGSDALGNDKSFAMTARQSRIGMRYSGTEIMGAKLSGQAEVDFFGGKAALGNGINMDLVRLRLAFGRLDWKNFSFEAGQDWAVFAPLNPTTLAEFAIPGLSASGNPWIRMPQLRAEFHNDLNEKTRFLFQVAAIDPDIGDYSTATFATARTPGIGERGRYPGVDSRLGITTKAVGRDFAFGISSHYSRGKNSGAVGPTTYQLGVDSWGTAIDYNLPVSKYFAFSGEWYVGRALGIYSVSAGESVLPVGVAGSRGVLSKGGWSQAQINFNSKWQANLSYGIDTERNRELRVGDRDKNQSYVGNVIYKYTSHVNFAWEWRRFLTNWKAQPTSNEIGNTLNLAVAYIF